MRHRKLSDRCLACKLRVSSGRDSLGDCVHGFCRSTHVSNTIPDLLEMLLTGHHLVAQKDLLIAVFTEVYIAVVARNETDQTCWSCLALKPMGTTDGPIVFQAGSYFWY